MDLGWMMEQWYTLYTKANAEYKVVSYLREHGIEVYLPEVPVPARKTTQKQPLFPCYLFAQLDLTDGNPSLWRWTPGLRRLVSYGDQPIPLPPELINVMKLKLAQRNTAASQSHPYQVGDIVRIKEGPFKDMLAVFDGPMTPSKRVHVLLTALGQYRRLRLDPAYLETAPTKSVAKSNRRRRTRGHGRRINYQSG
jgi:transcriptional antiterminator RfaH